MSHYEMTVFCDNCRKVSTLKIEKGVLKEEAIDEEECPNCGVEGRLEFSD